ncbi:DUF4923 family protein [Flavobacterium sp.]|uniref:lipocalin-like domain-containing protein n=1 Tax=Flavobacterium sp. TaxID=239 RepID=UPI00121BD98D|nr:DUF4923 family protein [Flavobacterium sp.]RZJ72041.1 MAG: hypothetical protein EOO49_08420 [Flavobacterium sp.]
MKKVALVFFMFFAVSAFAQTEKQILGKWAFQSLADTPDLDEESKKMAGDIFKDMSFDFTADKKVTFSMMGKSETGTYTYDAAQKTIAMTSAKGKVINLPITAYSEKEMTINFQGKASMVLKRS